MIIKVSELLGKHKMSRKNLADVTGIKLNTVSALYDETIKRLDVELLNQLCKAFHCSIADLLEYVPDEEWGQLIEGSFIRFNSLETKITIDL